MKPGYLIVNLGSPKSPSEHDVRVYLRQFLMDPYVIDVPFLLRWLIVELGILRSRPKESAEAYHSIWTENGSPLIHISRQFVQALRQRISEPIALGMRYGEPSVGAGIRELQTQGVDHIVLVPMYPHHAMSSVTTVVEEFKSQLRVLAPTVPFTIVPPFYAHPEYISSLVTSIRPAIEHYDHLLFSYHGLPERHLKKCDPTGGHCLTENCCSRSSVAHETCYKHQVMVTAQKVVDALGLTPDQWSVSFQSRLGKDPWITPFTDVVIPELVQRGVKRLAVVCPAFVADCLETIEEIGERARDQFLEAGGEAFGLIDCLNDDPEWADAVVRIVSDVVPEDNFAKPTQTL